MRRSLPSKLDTSTINGRNSMASSTSDNSTKGRRGTADPPHLNVVSLLLLVIGGGLGIGVAVLTGNALAVVLGFVLGGILALSPRVVQQWERAVVLRLGRYTG